MPIDGDAREIMLALSGYSRYHITITGSEYSTYTMYPLLECDRSTCGFFQHTLLAPEKVIYLNGYMWGWKKDMVDEEEWLKQTQT